MKMIKSTAAVIAPAILALSLVSCGKDLNTRTIAIGQTSAKRDNRPLREPTAEALFAAKYSDVNVECEYFLKSSSDTSTNHDFTNMFPVYPVTKDEKLTKVVSDHSSYNGQVKLVTVMSVDQEVDSKTQSVVYNPIVTLSGSQLMVKKDAGATPLVSDLNTIAINLNDLPEKNVVVGTMSLDNHVNNTTDTFKVVCHLNLTPLATTIK